MGYKLAGCDVIGANDIDPEMAWHYKKNLNPKYYFLCPIKDLLKQDLPEELYNLDILDGSPPCSTFSMSGKREKNWGKDKKFREGQAKQVLSDLFFDFIDIAEVLQPKVVIAENVKGMILGNAKGYTRAVMKRFDEIGYKTQLFLVNAKNCGVPQSRERVFFCGLRKDIEKPNLKLEFKESIVSVGIACEDIQNLTAEETKENKPTILDLKFWKYTKKNNSYEKASLKLEKKKNAWNHIRIDNRLPCNTLTSQPHIYTHWNEMRKLTFREFKRIGSFPDDYKAKNERIGKYLIGMSVPPKMTMHLAKQVIGQWLK